MPIIKRIPGAWAKLIVCFSLLSMSYQVFAEEGNAKVPLLANIGIGPSFVKLYDPVFKNEDYIYGVHIDLSGVAEKETIMRFKDSLPKKYRGVANHVGEVKVSSGWIPSSIILTPYNSTRGEAYGVRFNPINLGLGLGMGPITFKVDAGLDFTYLYLNAPNTPTQDNKPTHFFRPGVHGGTSLHASLHRFLKLEIGRDDALFWPKDYTNDETLTRLSEVYALLHLRIPFEK